MEGFRMNQRRHRCRGWLQGDVDGGGKQMRNSVHGSLWKMSTLLMRVGIG